MADAVTTNTPSSVSDEERLTLAVARAIMKTRVRWNWTSGKRVKVVAIDLLMAEAAIDALKGAKLNLDPSATMTDTRVAEAVEKERAEPSPIDDEVTRAFIDGWNARLDHRDFDMALHFWMLAGVTHVGGVAIRNEEKGAPPVDQMKGEGGA